MQSMQGGYAACQIQKETIMQRSRINEFFESSLVLGLAALFAVALITDLRASEPSGGQSLVAQQANLLVAQHDNASRRG